MDDERLEMNEKMMEMESKAVKVENSLRQQVRYVIRKFFQRIILAKNEI